MSITDQTIQRDEPLVLDRGYSSFWPLAILLVALLGWFGYQACISYSQGAELRAELTKAQPAIANAETSRSRLINLVRDLAQTGMRDQYAAQIAKEYNIPLSAGSDTGTGR